MWPLEHLNENNKSGQGIFLWTWDNFWKRINVDPLLFDSEEYV